MMPFKTHTLTTMSSRKPTGPTIPSGIKSIGETKYAIAPAKFAFAATATALSNANLQRS